MEKGMTGQDKKTGETQKPASWYVSGGLTTGPDLPTGTVTFLFTDIEGSTPHWERQPDLMEEALKLHNEVLFQAIQTHQGKVFKIVGDEFQAVFTTAPQALQAAIDIQLGLQSADWNELGSLKVRIGLHTGGARLDDIGDEYAVSATKNRVGRIRSAAHGGQILLSKESADLCETKLPDGVSLRYLGEYQMKGLTRLEPLYQAVVPGLQGDFPPLATMTAAKNNLPLELTSFIEREKEIWELAELLEQYRLVTLTGVGGTGKTRLALRTAETVLGDYPDGIWFVELAPLADPELVARILITALGMQESALLNPLDQLKAHLRHKQLLLMLDNCEHVIEECARIIYELLKACPGLKIMATSREALRVTGEVAYPVPSLPFPNPGKLPPLEQLKQNPSVQLFLERARAVKPGFMVTTDNAQAVTQVCKRLDGIPLAIELAAARVNVFSPAQIAERLDDRFRLLTGGARTAVPRQQTLRACIDWSYAHLEAKERLLLMRLSVFQGGWTLELAIEVCGFDELDEYDVIDGMVQLVNQSLIYTASAANGINRYHRLETIRQYSREKLLDSGQSDILYNRHLEAFVRLGEEAKTHLNSHGQIQWLDQLESELDNMRVALAWALEQDAAKGLELATSLFWFWFLRGYHTEWGKWIERFQERVNSTSGEVDIGLLAESMARQAMMNLLVSDVRTKQSYHIAEEALRLAKESGDKQIQAVALIAMVWQSTSFRMIEQLSRQCLKIAEEIDDHVLIRQSLTYLALSESDQFKAKTYLERIMELAIVSGDIDGFLVAQFRLGEYYYFIGEYSKALQFYEQALQTAQGMRHPVGIAIMLNNLVEVYYALGKPVSAIEAFQQSLEINRDLGDQTDFSPLYVSLGYTCALGGDWEEAKKCFQQAAQTAAMSRNTYRIAYSQFGLAEVAWSFGKVEIAAQYYRKSVEGTSRKDDIYLAGLGAFASGMESLLRSDVVSSKICFIKALKIFFENRWQAEMANCLEALALCSFHDDLYEIAVRFRGTAISCRGWRVAKLGISRVIKKKVEDTLEGVREILGESRYEALLQEGQAVRVEDAVAYVQGLLGE